MRYMGDDAMLKLLIGIDPGRHTGFSWALNGHYQGVETLRIHKAMQRVDELVSKADDIMIVVEDARLRGCRFKSAAKAQGAGSVKRDCVIWQDYFEEFASLSSFATLFVSPNKKTTKISPNHFKVLTGWCARTSHHARDAAMLIIDMVQIDRLEMRKREGNYAAQSRSSI